MLHSFRKKTAFSKPFGFDGDNTPESHNLISSSLVNTSVAVLSLPTPSSQNSLKNESQVLNSLLKEGVHE